MIRWNLFMRIANQRNLPDMSNKVLWIPVVLVVGALVLAKWKGCTPVWRVMAKPNLLYSRSLPANHQLAVDDIDLNHQDSNRVSVHDSVNSFLGCHLVQAKKAGETIRGVDLARTPVVPQPGKDSSIFLLTPGATELPLLQVLDAGEYLQVADTDHDFQPGWLVLRVIAAHRSTSAVPGNWLLVEGPTGKAKENQLRISSKARGILLVNRPDSTAIAGCGVKVKPCRKPVIFPGKH